jgi:hypothetical protein
VDTTGSAGLLPAHGRRQKVVRLELFGDLPPRLVRFPVRNGAAARNYLQTGDRGQFAAHLVRDAVHEVFVFGSSEVLEGKHRKALDAWRRPGTAQASCDEGRCRHQNDQDGGNDQKVPAPARRCRGHVLSSFSARKTSYRTGAERRQNLVGAETFSC